jgi:hypothetical protein
MSMDFEGIRSEVVAAGGIKCFPMQVLRDASPYKKLGPGVNTEISNALRQKSLEHSELRLYQHEQVYVYEQGSSAARLINAITGEPSLDGAAAILDAVSSTGSDTSAEKTLADVKALVVEMNDAFELYDGGS